MPFAGTFDPTLPGEEKAFSIDFVNDLAPGDTLATATATLECFYGVDPNVALLTPVPPVIDGSLVIQMIGLGAYGFQPGILYRWTVTVETTGGWTLMSYAHLPCTAVT